MSTRGVLSIRKDGTEKGMAILHDAYPAGAGVDIVDLIKSTDLNVLYYALTVYDEWDIPEEGEEEYPDEPDDFSYGRCRLAVKHKKKIWVSPGTVEDIRDSLFCEYAYVIDLDRDELLFFIGGQRKPKEGNPYGSQWQRHLDMKEEYYPCRLSAVFPFQYIRAAKSEYVANEMELAEERKDICTYNLEMLEDGLAGKDDYSVDITNISDLLNSLNKKMESLTKALTESHPESKNRIREIRNAVMVINKTITELGEQIEIIT